MKAAAATPHEPASEPSPVLFTALRVLGFLALALMLGAILYSIWIALENWGSIQV
jgi:hypothetical protein